ncbi:CU044_2847 family protein [Streptomyces sp. NPDC051940]|uniref:CU044_2847 family protein n=1 Tax=Streptomyces sp. NPDC051940 TaxID=3155675 RepID=UPI0034341847
MATSTPFELDDGTLLRVETAAPAHPRPAADDDAYEPIGRPRAAHAAGDAADSLRDAVDRVRPAVQDLVDSLRGLPRRPDRISLEFGVKVTAEAGAVVARTAAEAHFTVGVEWEAASGRSGADDV